MIKLDETYVEKYSDIEERAEIAKQVSIEIIDPNEDSDSMVKVRITNNSGKTVNSVNYECELFDKNNQKIHSEINQTWETIEPGASREAWATFNSDAGAKRKEVKLRIVGATI